MALYDSPKTTYSEGASTPNNQERIISNVINMIDPIDTPLLALLGGLDGGRSKVRVSGKGTKIEWMEDKYLPIATTITEAQASTSDLTFTVADAELFRNGTMFKIDDEVMICASVNKGTKVVTVYARGHGSSSAATHADNAAVEIIGIARPEGADADYDAMTKIEFFDNYTQIYQTALKMTGTEMVIDEIGYDDVWAYQANKKMPEMLRLVERSLFWGLKDAGSATGPRTYAGMDALITTNVTTSVGSIAKADIDAMALTIRLAGGNPSAFVCHPSVANDLRDLVDTSAFVRLDQSNSVLGMNALSGISTQYGPLRIVEDRWCPTSKAYVIDPSKMGLVTLRPFQWSPLARHGDYEHAELIGEFSFVLANEYIHGKLTGIS